MLLVEDTVKELFDESWFGAINKEKEIVRTSEAHANDLGTWTLHYVLSFYFYF